MQVEFSKQVQELTEQTGTEISPAEIWDVFTTTYQPENATIQLLSSEVTADQHNTRIFAQLVVAGQHVTVKGEGNGPIDALMTGLRNEIDVYKRQGRQSVAHLADLVADRGLSMRGAEVARCVGEQRVELVGADLGRSRTESSIAREEVRWNS